MSDTNLIIILLILFGLPLAYVFRFIYRVMRGEKFKPAETKPVVSQGADEGGAGSGTKLQSARGSQLYGGVVALVLLFYWFIGRHMIGSVDYTVSATDLVFDFLQNEVAAYAKYEGKVVQVSGSIIDTTVSLGVPLIVLAGPVSCGLKSSEMQRAGSLKRGQEVVLVGEVSGGRGFLDGGVTLMPCRLERLQ